MKFVIYILKQRNIIIGMEFNDLIYLKNFITEKSVFYKLLILISNLETVTQKHEFNHSKSD